MTYQVLARKWRPKTFADLVGQEHVVKALKNALDKGRLHHAYLLTGTRGVGKTTIARILAKSLNCENPHNGEPCGECRSCREIDSGRFVDLLEIDAASNTGIDNIREVLENAQYAPTAGKYKVYIIDEVHMLSQSAFNSFLKTLEEPPPHAIFILATTEKQKIIPTILSRCQVYDFNRITIADIVAHLQFVADKEGVKSEVEALNIIAQKADGGMRDALSIFDQTVSYTGGNITYQAVIENLNLLDYEYYFKLSDAILEANVVDCLLILNDILNRGFDGQYFISGISSHFRDLLVCKDAATAQLFQVGASIRERYIAMAKRCSNQFLYQAIEITNECDLNYRQSKNRRLLIELTLIRLCQLTPQDAPLTPKPEKKRAIEPIVPKERATETAQATANDIQDRVKSDEVKPASTPMAKPAETTTSPRKKKEPLSEMGVSIAAITDKKKEEPSSPELELQQHDGNNLFTENELIHAWREYADSLEEERLLKNTMTLYLPKMLGKTLFEVEVNTELNKQYLIDHSAALLSFLREKLRNGDITMTIRIAETNAIKKPLTSREIFDEMAQQNPSLQKLSDEFGLELS